MQESEFFNQWYLGKIEPILLEKRSALSKKSLLWLLLLPAQSSRFQLYFKTLIARFLLSYFSSWKSFKAVYAEKVWYCEADLAVLFCLLLKVGKFGRPFIFTFHIAISWKANPKDMFRKIWFAKCIAGKKVHCPKYIAGRIYFCWNLLRTRTLKVPSFQSDGSLLSCHMPMKVNQDILHLLLGSGDQTIKSILVRRVWGKGAWSSLNPMQYIQIPALPQLWVLPIERTNPVLLCISNHMIHSIFSIFSTHTTQILVGHSILKVYFINIQKIFLQQLLQTF